MRVREVEIHHADLDAGYAAADWPEGFRVVLLESMTKRPYPAPFGVRPTDLDRTWRYGDGDGGPVVSGTSAALGWWLTGRGTGEGLTTDSGNSPGGGVMVNESYTGEVSPGGDPDVRVLGCLTVTKVAVDPEMSNNCYLLHCGDDRRGRADRRRRGARAAARADRRHAR